MKNSIGALLFLILIGNNGIAQTRGIDPQIKLNSISLSTGVRLEYAERGSSSGAAVIFLHGITDSWHSFEKVLPLLPNKIHAFAISQRGHGDSDRPPVGYHPRDFAADVAAFVKEKNLGKVVVVGHSMGGFVAQQFVLDYPQLAKGMILVGTDAALYDNPGLPEFQKEVASVGETISRDFMEAFQKSTLAVSIDPNYFETIVQEGMKVPGPVFRAAFDGLMEVDYVERLNTVQVPVLILWGDKDIICFAADQELMQKHLMRCTKLVYAGTGHALHWEKPIRFANDVAGFVRNLD